MNRSTPEAALGRFPLKGALPVTRQVRIYGGPATKTRS